MKVLMAEDKERSVKSEFADELLERLKAPRWRERAEAAHLAASTLVAHGYVPNFSATKDSTGKVAIHVVDIYDKLLRQLVHGLALKDSQWQVRIAAVESAATILAAPRDILPADLFAAYVWGVLAACLDSQPEVQLAASYSILQRLLSSPSHERDAVVTQLCDRFVAATLGADAVPTKFAKLSTQGEVVGLDNIPDGEVLLAGTTAAFCLQLVPFSISEGAGSQENQELKGMSGSQRKQEIDRIPLLVVAAAVATEDANRRQSRTIALGLSKLLRCLGAPCYRQSIVSMFDPRAPVYLFGSSLAITYQNSGIVDEDTVSAMKNIRTATILKGLALALEASDADQCLIVRDDLPITHIRKVFPISNKEVVALQHIVEMLQVPADLTKTIQDKEMECKIVEFVESAMLLLSISTSLIKKGNSVPEDVSLPKKLVEDLVLCCAAFAGGNDEFGVAPPWTSKQLRELSMTLLNSLLEIWEGTGTRKMSKSTGSIGPEVKTTLNFISGHMPYLLPRIKQTLQDSSVTSGSEVFHKLSPDGSVASSIIAAYQMDWILRQLEFPHLSPHCELVMPCVLTALDHFSPEVKRQAMRSFVHLAQNLSPTELRWYKDVILDAVSRSLVGCGDLWPAAVKMAVTAVCRIEGRNPRGSWYGRILTEMIGELERQRDDQGHRVSWLKEISPQMELMGLVLVAHFKRLLPLLFYWLHAPDDTTCILSLTRLQTVIIHTWPRIPFYVKRIWKELVLTYGEANKRKLTSEIRAAIMEVGKLLYSCAGPEFEVVWQQDKDDSSINELVAFLKTLSLETVVEG